jgi:hypothetical protein
VPVEEPAEAVPEPVKNEVVKETETKKSGAAIARTNNLYSSHAA